MTRLVSAVLPTGFGVLMALTTAVGAAGPAVVAAAAAVISVLAGVVYRPAATLAVLLAASAIGFGTTPPVLAAVSGFAAASYLILRHTAAVTAPTVIALAGLTFVGLVATAFPLRVTWLPLLAPLAAFGCYVLAIRPFLGDRG